MACNVKQVDSLMLNDWHNVRGFNTRVPNIKCERTFNVQSHLMLI